MAMEQLPLRVARQRAVAHDHRRTTRIDQHVIDAAHAGRHDDERAERRDDPLGRRVPVAGRDHGEAEHDLRERVELADRRGIALHGTEEHAVRQGAKGDHEVAQQHQRRDEPRHPSFEAQADEHRYEQHFVRERIEVLAEFTGPAEALRERAIEPIRERRDREQRHHFGVTPLQDPVGHRVDQQDPDDAEQVRQETQAHEDCQT